MSCRPDFTVLIYPAYLTNKAKDALSPEIRVTKETPPMFLALAGNDGGDGRRTASCCIWP